MDYNSHSLLDVICVLSVNKPSESKASIWSIQIGQLECLILFMELASPYFSSGKHYTKLFICGSSLC